MTFAELRAKLFDGSPAGTATIAATLGFEVPEQILTPFYSGGSILITLIGQPLETPGPTPSTGSITIEGSAPFLSAPITSLADGAQVAVITRIASAPVKAVFQLESETSLQVSLEFTLAADWKFADSFPELPAILDPSNDAEISLPASLTGSPASLSGARFVFRNVPGGFNGEDLDGGLNLVATWDSGGLLGILEELKVVAAPVLTGSVVVPGGDPPALADGEFPWQVTRPPGIHLRVPLARERSIASTLTVRETSLSIYTPLDSQFQIEHPEYEPQFGFRGGIDLPSAASNGSPVSLELNGRKLLGVDSLQLTGALTNAPSLANLGAALSDLVGAGDGVDALLAPIGSAASRIKLKRIGVSLDAEGNSFGVDQVSAVVTLGLEWPPPNSGWPFPRIDLDELTVLVQKPFSSADRGLAAHLSGSLTLLGSTFAVTGFASKASASTAASFHFEAVQDDQTIRLSALFDTHFPGTPKPPDLAVRDMRISASSDGSFDASLQISADPWRIDETTTVPSVVIALSNTGWRFAGQSSEAGIPIVALLSKLAQELGLGDMQMSETVADMLVTSFEISHDRESGDYALSAAGSLEVEGLGSKIAIALTADIKDIGGGAFSKEYGGHIEAAGMLFDLQLKAKTFVAAFHFEKEIGAADPSDPFANAGRFNLKSLLQSLAPPAVQAALPDLEIDFEDAFLVFQKDTQSRFLFGIDAGAPIDLTSADEQVRKLGLSLQQTGALTFRILAATKPFSPEAVALANTLLPAGLAPLPAEARHGSFAIRAGLDASLRVGELVVGQDPVEDTPPAQNGGANNPPAAPAPSDRVSWFSIQRSLGPLHVSRIGVRFKDSQICFLLDAAVSAGGLRIGFDGLSVCTTLTAPSLTFGLSGLSLSYTGSTALEIGGSFLKVDDNNFVGSAVIKAAKLSLTAFGGYELGDPPSLFVFATLDYPLGGPSFFFVTGVAAGFGYNRDLLLPEISGVRSYPFVSAVLDGPPPDILQRLAGTASTPALAPKRAGAYWIAAGIHFTSFQLVDSFALLFVKFGPELEFQLLGVSTMTLPKTPAKEPPRKPYLSVELAVRVSVKPSEGLFAAEALLTENSFVIHPACRLSGGFAFYSWFSGPHEGDFVLTVGGYHPRFSVPAHYPKVPRLGINWPVGSGVFIKGEAYFALTPSCVMAGGRLEASYNSGAISASFTASADFLIRWEPFSYDIEVFLSISAQVDWETIFGLVHFGFQLDAGVRIWGPEFAGIAHVKWGLISFEVPLGAARTSRPVQVAISFAAFRKAFLPLPVDDGMGWQSDYFEVAENLRLQICQVNIEAGLDREVEMDGRTRWVVRPDAFELSTQTAIPASGVVFSDDADGTLDANIKIAGLKRGVGLRPVGGGPAKTIHRVSISFGGLPLDLAAGWDWNRNGKRLAVPQELWDIGFSAEPPKGPSAELIPNHLVGVIGLRPMAKPLTGATLVLLIEGFAFTDLPRALPRFFTQPASRQQAILVAVFGTIDLSVEIDVDAAYADLQATVNTATTAARRTGIIQAAADNGFPGFLVKENDVPRRLNADMGTLALRARQLLQSAPMRGELGSRGQAPARPATLQALAPPDLSSGVITRIVRFLLSILEYQSESLGGESEFRTETMDAQARFQTLPEAPPSDSASGAADAATTPPFVSGTQEQPLIAGQSLVMSIEDSDPEDPQQTVLEFREGAGLRFRISTTDIYRKPLSVSEISAPSGANAVSRFQVPPKARQLVVTAVASPADAPAGATDNAQAATSQGPSFGWTRASLLIRIAPQTFHGVGATVRTEASNTPLSGTAPGGVGVVRGGDLVRENQAPVPPEAGHPAATRTGWFQTELPAGCRTLAVLVRRSALPGAPGSSTRVEAKRKDGATLRLQPLHVFRQSPDEFVMLYRLPADLERERPAGATKDSPDDRISILTQATNNWELQGVVGVLETIERVRLNWDEFRLRSSVSNAGPTSTEPPARARLMVVAA